MDGTVQFATLHENCRHATFPVREILTNVERAAFVTVMLEFQFFSQPCSESTSLRPTDEDIVAQQNSLREEVARASPFVGDKVRYSTR